MQLKPTDGSDDTRIMLIFSDCECDDEPQAAHTHSFQAAESEEGTLGLLSAGREKISSNQSSMVNSEKWKI